MSEAPAPVNVLVVFGPVSETLEPLASAAAVGAVQARGNIRLRRLDAADGPLSGEIERIRDTYIVPGSGDVEWADAVVLVTGGAEGADWDPFLELLVESRERLGAVLWIGEEPGPLVRALNERGVSVLPSPQASASTGRSLENVALITGRWIVMTARQPAAGPPAFEAAVSLLPREHELAE